MIFIGWRIKKNAYEKYGLAKTLKGEIVNLSFIEQDQRKINRMALKDIINPPNGCSPSL